MIRMATLYIRNVPPEVYEALKARAKREGRSVNAEALLALEELTEEERGRAAIDRFLALGKEIGKKMPPDGPSVVEIIRQMREERTEHLMRVIWGDSD
jgi:plasmid stability protein